MLLCLSALVSLLVPKSSYRSSDSTGLFLGDWNSPPENQRLMDHSSQTDLPDANSASVLPFLSLSCFILVGVLILSLNDLPEPHMEKAVRPRKQSHSKNIFTEPLFSVQLSSNLTLRTVKGVQLTVTPGQQAPLELCGYAPWL